MEVFCGAARAAQLANSASPVANRQIHLRQRHLIVMQLSGTRSTLGPLPRRDGAAKPMVLVALPPAPIWFTIATKASTISNVAGPTPRESGAVYISLLVANAK